MNKYEKPENNINRVPNQNNMANVPYNQVALANFPGNEAINFQRVIYPGNPNLANQRIAMQQMPTHIQPNQFNFCNSQYPGFFQQNCYVQNNQMYSPVMHNSYQQMQTNTNIMRPSMAVYNTQPQPTNMYQTQIDKTPSNHPSNILNYPNIILSTYYQQQGQPIQQIQHPTSHHIQNQIQPHLQPQHHPHMPPQQLQNQFVGIQQPNIRTYPIMPIEKPGKTNSALEIINPETNKLVDLTLFKNENQIEKSRKTEFMEIKIDKTEYRELQVEQNKLAIDSQIHKNDAHTLITDENEYQLTHGEDENYFHVNEIDSQQFSEPIVNTFEYCDIQNNTSEAVESRNELSVIISSSTNHQNHIHYETLPEGESVNEDLHNSIIDCVQEKESNTVEAYSFDLRPVKNTDIVMNNGHKTYSNKYIYSRDELIKISKNILSRQKPKGLPFKEEFTDPIILDSSINMSNLENVESMHSINQKYSKVHKTSQGGTVGWRNLNMKNMQSFPKCINLGNTENVLSKSDDGYVTCKQRLAAGEELSETEELIRQIKGILNRIVPQNFDQCLDDLVSLKIGTHEGMTCLVNELFLKAVKEEAYSVTFAKICSYLASIKADVSDHEIVTFRSVMLQKCQAMFTTPLEEQLENVRQEWMLKASIEKPKTKAMMESDVDEQIKKAKDRYYGNIRFIGELYLKGVLITKIICFCIENLLTKENDADSLICLCKLLETCGAKLETESKGKDKLNDSFKKLNFLSESAFIETRVRFRILDIVEMRQKNWHLRKVQQEQKIQPKTLEEIKIEKEMEEEKDYYSSLNRKNLNNWTPDRRPSLPNVNKNRSHFLPKQLTVTTSSNDSTMLGPQKRNWTAGSGSKINTYNTSDNEKRMSKQRGKMNSEARQKDVLCCVENSDYLLGQSTEGIVSNFPSSFIHQPSLAAFSYQSTNSSENSSRSSSHGRSTPQILKEKLQDSKLTQSISIEIALLSPVEFFKEYTRTSKFCTDSWNSYSDKVEVVYQWLDSNFDTDCDNRTSLSLLLSKLINQNMMEKEDLLKAFSKIIDLLEDLIIDVGQSIWDGLSDYFIPFLESLETDSIDLIDCIFDFEALERFESKNAYIIYSLPWKMANKIIKFPSIDKSRDIFKTVVIDDMNKLSICEQKLISIISKNLFRAIKILSKLNSESYLNWVVRNAESFSRYSTEFFVILNWEEMFHQIQADPCFEIKFAECLKMLSSMSKNNEIVQTLCKIVTRNANQTSEGMLLILRCLLKTEIFNVQMIQDLESESQSGHVPQKLKDVLTIVLTNPSAFISDTSSDSPLSNDGSNNFSFFRQSTFDHDTNCTNRDSD